MDLRFIWRFLWLFFRSLATASKDRQRPLKKALEGQGPPL